MNWTTLGIGAKHLLLKQLREWKETLLAKTHVHTTVSCASTLKRSQEISQNHGWPTTRTFPRTLAEAYPKDHAEWWHPPKKRPVEYVYAGVVIALWVGLAVYYWKTL